MRRGGRACAIGEPDLPKALGPAFGPDLAGELVHRAEEQVLRLLRIGDVDPVERGDLANRGHRAVLPDRVVRDLLERREERDRILRSVLDAVPESKADLAGKGEKPRVRAVHAIHRAHRVADGRDGRGDHELVSVTAVKHGVVEESRDVRGVDGILRHRNQVGDGGLVLRIRNGRRSLRDGLECHGDRSRLGFREGDLHCGSLGRCGFSSLPRRVVSRLLDRLVQLDVGLDVRRLAALPAHDDRDVRGTGKRRIHDLRALLVGPGAGGQDVVLVDEHHAVCRTLCLVNGHRVPGLHVGEPVGRREKLPPRVLRPAVPRAIRVLRIERGLPQVLAVVVPPRAVLRGEDVERHGRVTAVLFRSREPHVERGVLDVAAPAVLGESTEHVRDDTLLGVLGKSVPLVSRVGVVHHHEFALREPAGIAGEQLVVDPPVELAHTGVRRGDDLRVLDVLRVGGVSERILDLSPRRVAAVRLIHERAAVRDGRPSRTSCDGRDIRVGLPVGDLAELLGVTEDRRPSALPEYVRQVVHLEAGIIAAEHGGLAAHVTGGGDRPHLAAVPEEHEADSRTAELHPRDRVEYLPADHRRLVDEDQPVLRELLLVRVDGEPLVRGPLPDAGERVEGLCLDSAKVGELVREDVDGLAGQGRDAHPDSRGLRIVLQLPDELVDKGRLARPGLALDEQEVPPARVFSIPNRVLDELLGAGDDLRLLGRQTHLRHVLRSDDHTVLVRHGLRDLLRAGGLDGHSRDDWRLCGFLCGRGGDGDRHRSALLHERYRRVLEQRSHVLGPRVELSDDSADLGVAGGALGVPDCIDAIEKLPEEPDII